MKSSIHKIIASAIVVSATLFPQISAAKIAAFEPVVTYKENKNPYNDAYKYLTNSGANDGWPEIIPNAANIYNIHSYLSALPNAIENEFQEFARKINRTIAVQMAAANLFQPYSVGKLNFTAAVGGYKSEHSIAVGTGYRFNQNVAARASLSFTRGGVAYGAGVNFEY